MEMACWFFTRATSIRSPNFLIVIGLYVFHEIRETNEKFYLAKKQVYLVTT